MQVSQSKMFLGSLSNPSETVTSLNMLKDVGPSPTLTYSPVRADSQEPIQRSLVPNVAALNRREFLKFEAMYQVKEENPKNYIKSNRRLKNERLVEIYAT